MTQFARPTLNAAVDDGITLSTKLNGAFPALYTNHAGAAAPPSPEKGQMWVDTSGETANPPVLVLRQYTGTVWREIGSLNLTTGLFTTAGGLPLTGGTVSGPILFPAGTAAAPSIAFAGDTGTGIWRIGASNIGFSTNGVQRISITNTNLDTSLATIRVQNASPGMVLDRSTGASGSCVFRFRTNNSDRWTWQMTGAESTGDAGSSLFLQMFSDAGTLTVNFLQFTRATRQMGINGALIGSAPVTIRTNGSAPAEDALEVINTNADVNGSVGINLRTAGGALRGAVRGVRPGNNNGDVQIHTATVGALNLAATFRANGDLENTGMVRAGRGVMFGDVAPWTTHRWRFRSDTIGSLFGVVQNLNDVDQGYQVWASNIIQISLGSGVMNIADNVGGFWSVDLNASDRRLKDNVAPSTVDALAEILAIPTFQFEWRVGAFGPTADTGDVKPPQPIGFITDTLPDDCVNRNGTYEGVNLLPLVARLTKALQQQQELIVALQNRVSALEGKS